MTPSFVVSFIQKAMEIALLLAAPMLLTALIVGVLVSIFQAATQINEMTLSFIPKLLAMIAVLIFAGPWMLGLIMDYTTRLIGSIPSQIG